MQNVLRFWLEEKKVDGFRIDAIKHLVESQNFENEPVKDYVRDREPVYLDMIHMYTANQEETLEILYEWRKLCDEISQKTGSSRYFKIYQAKNVYKVIIIFIIKRVLFLESSYDVEDIGQYYFYQNKPNAHLVFNFQFTYIKQKKPFERNENEPPEEYYNSTSELSLNRSFTPSNLKRLINSYMHYLPNGFWPNYQV